MPVSPLIPPFLWKIILAVACGGLAYGLTTITDQPQVWQLTITTFIGGAALVTQYMIDFERRLGSVEDGLARHTAAMEAAWTGHATAVAGLVDDGFARINEATRLFGRIADAAMPSDAVFQLVDAATAIGGAEPDLVYDFGEAEVRRVTELLTALKTTQVEYAGEDHDWLLTLTDCTRLSIDASSTSVDNEFWVTELGRRYLVAQRKAIQRGVRVRRVFIVGSAADIDETILDRCRRHADLGVEVRIATMSTFPETARIDTMIDFTVFDQAVIYDVRPELSARDQQPVIDRTRMYWQPTRVTPAVHRFEDLWAAADPPPPPTP